MTGNILRWFTCPQTVIHPSTNPETYGRASNSQPVDHKSDALTITPPSPALTPAMHAGTQGMEGSVDLAALLHTEMIYSPTDGHPSKY